MSSFADINQDTGLAVGQNGARYVASLSATGKFGAIQATEDTIFNTLVATNWIGDSTVGLRLPAGASIFGHFTDFTLTSGKVIAYNA